MERFNPQIPLRYGIIAFAFIVTIGLLMYVFYQTLISSFLLFASVGIFSLAVALFLGIWSGITYRKENGGIISFGHAFLAVYLVFVFHCLGSTTSLLLINKVIDKDYAEKASALLRDKMSDRFEKMNLTDEQIKDAMKNMSAENFDPPIVKQIQSLTISLGISAAVALLIALFIKRGSGDLIPSGLDPEPIKTI